MLAGGFLPVPYLQFADAYMSKRIKNLYVAAIVVVGLFLTANAASASAILIHDYDPSWSPLGTSIVYDRDDRQLVFQYAGLVPGATSAARCGRMCHGR